MSLILKPDEPHDSRMRRLVKSRSSSPTSPSVFGVSTERFPDETNAVPGVGRYSIETFGESSLLKKSPSLSRKGFVSSFVSKSAKQSFIQISPNPGPCSYEVYQGTLSVRPGSPQRPSTAFIPSGHGRVPFPAPNSVPGPAAYRPHPDPGVSPLLRSKESATFLSVTQRNDFLHVNDVPSAAKYKPHLVPVDRLSSPPRRARTAHGDLAPPVGYAPLHTPGSPLQITEPKIPLNGDIQFFKSTFVRFQDVGKDNKVPGPDRYFRDSMQEEYFPAKSLRSSGTYRGKYLGKLQGEKKRPPHTFGADVDRFKDSMYGRLDVKAQIPGPGTYFEDMKKCSSIQTPAPLERTMSPVKSTRSLEYSTPHSYNNNNKKKTMTHSGSTKKLPHSDYV